MDEKNKNIVLNSSSRNLLKFCEFSSSFLNTKNLRDSKSIKWFADCTEFNFGNNNGNPFIVFNSEFDLIAVGRALLSDPEWANKVQNGQEKDIVPFDKSFVENYV